jgi:RNA recognition motif-containing protein
LLLAPKEILFDREKQKKEIRMQGSKLYIGNLSYSVTNEQLEELFSNYGEVKEVNIIEGRGFGFVEMSNPSEAEKAQEALDGSDLEGRTLKVDEARPPRSGGQRGDGRPPRGRPRGGSQRGGPQRGGPRRY